MTEKMFELVPVGKKLLESSDFLKKGLQILKENFSTPENADTKEGYEKNKADARRCQKLRTALDKLSDRDKAKPAKEVKEINALKKTWHATLPEIETALKDANQVVDDRKAEEIRVAAEAEQARVENIASKISEIEKMPVSVMTSTSSEIQEKIDNLEAVEPEEWAEEKIDLTKEMISQTLASLKGVYLFRKGEEEKAEKVEKERIEREEKEAKAKAEADQKAKDEAAKLKADREKLDREKEELLEKQAAAQKVIDDQMAEIQKQKDEIAANEAAKVAEEKRVADELKAKEKAEKLKAQNILDDIELNKKREELIAKAKVEDKKRAEADEKERDQIHSSIHDTLKTAYDMTQAAANSFVDDLKAGNIPYIDIDYSKP